MFAREFFFSFFPPENRASLFEYEWNHLHPSVCWITDAPEPRRACSRRCPLRTSGETEEPSHSKAATHRNNPEALTYLWPSGHTRGDRASMSVRASRCWEGCWRRVAAGGAGRFDRAAASCVVPAQHAPPPLKRRGGGCSSPLKRGEPAPCADLPGRGNTGGACALINAATELVCRELRSFLQGFLFLLLLFLNFMLLLLRILH